MAAQYRQATRTDNQAASRRLAKTTAQLDVILLLSFNLLSTFFSEAEHSLNRLQIVLTTSWGIYIVEIVLRFLFVAGTVYC